MIIFIMHAFHLLLNQEMRQLVDAAGICCRLNIFSYSNIFAEMLPFLLFEFDVMSRVKIIKKIIIKIRKNKRNKEIKKRKEEERKLCKIYCFILRYHKNIVRALNLHCFIKEKSSGLIYN